MATHNTMSATTPVVTPTEHEQQALAALLGMAGENRMQPPAPPNLPAVGNKSPADGWGTSAHQRQQSMPSHPNPFGVAQRQAEQPPPPVFQPMLLNPNMPAPFPMPMHGSSYHTFR